MNTKKIADKSGLSESKVESVLEALSEQIISELRDNGEFIFYDLAIFKKIVRPAKPARKGTNPFTGEEQLFEAKPESTMIKINPLEKLKTTVNN